MSLIIGNALHLPLKDNYVQCVVTSPPYWNLREYKTGKWVRGDLACTHENARTKSRDDYNLTTKQSSNRGSNNVRFYHDCGCGAEYVDHQIGLEETPWEYTNKLVQVFKEVKRVLRNDGTVWLNIGSSFVSTRIESPNYIIRKDLPQSERIKIAQALSKVWYNDVSYKSNVSNMLSERVGQTRELYSTTLPKMPENIHNSQGSNNTTSNLADITFPKSIIPDHLLKYCEPECILKPKDDSTIPYMVTTALRNDGWYLRSSIIWNKGNGVMPESVKDRPTRSHEYIFLLTKSERYYYNSDAIAEDAIHTGETRNVTTKFLSYAQAVANNKVPSGNGKLGTVMTIGAKRNKRDVWNINQEPNLSSHYATFPTKLVEPCILAGSKIGDVVLDPFGGVGTVAYVAQLLGRKSVSIDLKPEYTYQAEKRINKYSLMKYAVFN